MLKSIFFELKNMSRADWLLMLGIITVSAAALSIMFAIQTPKNNAAIARLEEYKCECANSGHTWKECNDFWISSHEYKRRTGMPPSQQWAAFIAPKQ